MTLVLNEDLFEVLLKLLTVLLLNLLVSLQLLGLLCGFYTGTRIELLSLRLHHLDQIILCKEVLC